MINVDKREWMIDIRRKLGISRAGMAKACKCSELLLEKIEVYGAVTHHAIADRIAIRYGMDERRRDELLPEDMRGMYGEPVWQEPPGGKDFSWTTYAQAIEKEVDEDEQMCDHW